MRSKEKLGPLFWIKNTCLNFCSFYLNFSKVYLLRVLFARTLATDLPLALTNVEKKNKIVFIDAHVTLAAIILKMLSVSRHLWINVKLCGEMRLKGRF